MADFKKNILDLVIFFDGLTERINKLNLNKTLSYEHDEYVKKVVDVKKCLG